MTQGSAFKRVMVGALIGLAIAVVIVILITVVRSWPYVFPIEEMGEDQRMDRLAAIRRLGMVIGFVLVPAGLLIGAGAGAIRHLVRTKSPSRPDPFGSLR